MMEKIINLRPLHLRLPTIYIRPLGHRERTGHGRPWPLYYPIYGNFNLNFLEIYFEFKDRNLFEKVMAFEIVCCRRSNSAVFA